MKNLYVLICPEDGASLFLKNSHAHLPASVITKGRTMWLFTTAETLKFMFWCQSICRYLWNDLQQDMWLAKAIYFSHKIFFSVIVKILLKGTRTSDHVNISLESCQDNECSVYHVPLNVLMMFQNCIINCCTARIPALWFMSVSAKETHTF